MTLVQGELKLVTDAPDEVSQVWIQAPKERLYGTGMITDGRASEQVKNGVVSFNVLPGAAVMVLLVNGIPSLTVKLLVPDKANATLRECIEAVGLADDGELDALEELALEVARVAAQIASADRLESWASETASAAAQAQLSKDEANNAANRASGHRSNAEQAESNAKQAEANAKQHEIQAGSYKNATVALAQNASNAAASAADDVREELKDSIQGATESAAAAKTSETNAATHEEGAKDAAERAEFAATETIQQVEGDFATRNYVDSAAAPKADKTYVDSVTLLKSGLSASSNVDTLPTGLYPVPSTSVATTLELPLGQPGELVTTWLDSGLRRRQTYYTDVTTPNLGMSIYRRWYYNGTWQPWTLESQSYPTVLGTENLNDLTQNGTYIQASLSDGTKERNYPTGDGGSTSVGVLRVTSSSGFVEQIFTEFREGRIHIRGRSVSGSWNDWTTLPNQTGSASSGLPVLDMEVTGKWTPNANGDEFLKDLAAKHEMVTVKEIGRSRHDWPIYAAVIGDPTLPAVLVIAGQHGTEVGPPEGAWLWCRELTKQKSLALMDVCVIVVPMVNPDNRFIARGNKAAVDLNRDWIDLSQPETQAVSTLFTEYNIVAGVDVHNFGYPRETSYKESAYGDTTTQSLALELANVIETTLTEDGQPVRRYGPENADTSFPNATSTLHEIPCVLIEIPCGGYGTWTFDVYNPAPSWQAYIVHLSCDAILSHVANNIASYNRELQP